MPMRDASSPDFWLAKWLDEEGATMRTDVLRLLQDEGRRKKFRQLLESLPHYWPAEDPDAKASVAAASGLDLSGSMGQCSHPDCLKGEVDRLVQRTWHYFDRVVVAGPSSFALAQVWDHDEDRAIGRIADYAEVLTHIRGVGAAELFVFSEKPPACHEHLPQHAADVDMSALLDMDDIWVNRLLPGADISIEWEGAQDDCHESHWRYHLNHPVLEHTRWGSVHAPRGAEHEKIVRLALADTYRDHVAHLVTDIQYARHAGSALGAVAPVHEDILGERPRVVPSVTEVAFELPLPVLEGVSTRDLLALRADHTESFEVFRSALRSAITERLKSFDEDAATATSVAVGVAEDVIAPALARIGNEVRSAERLLSRSGGLTLAVGAVATTVGLLLNMPMVVGPLVGAAVAGTDLKKYFSDKREVEMSDMYFLWRLAGVR